MGEWSGAHTLVSDCTDVSQEPLTSFLATTQVQPRWVTCPIRTSHIFISFAFDSSFRSFLIFSSSSVVFTESVWRASRSTTRPNLLIISWRTVSSISKRRCHYLRLFRDSVGMKWTIPVTTTFYRTAFARGWYRNLCHQLIFLLWLFTCSFPHLQCRLPCCLFIYLKIVGKADSAFPAGLHALGWPSSDC